MIGAIFASTAAKLIVQFPDAYNIFIIFTRLLRDHYIFIVGIIP
jgi:hypothetical protein